MFLRNKAHWLLGVMMFFSYVVKGQGYEIDLQIKGVALPEMYLGYYFGEKQYVKDTASILTDISGVGHYQFKGEEPLKEGIYFIYHPEGVYFQMVPDEQAFALKTDTLDLTGHMDIQHSPKNELFIGYEHFITSQNNKAQQIQQQLQALPEGATDQQKAFQEQLMQLDQDVKARQSAVLTQHPESMTAKIIKATKRPEVPASLGSQLERVIYYRSHFWDNFDLSDPALLRTQFYAPKVEEYMEKLTYPQPDSLFDSAVRLIELSKGDEETFRYMVVNLSNQFEMGKRIGAENVFVKLAERYYLSGQATWAEEETISKIEERVNQLKPNLIGERAPDLVLRDPEGNELNMADHSAPFTVLFFYDPECGHCKKETPKVLEAFHELRDQGVEFWGVNTTTDTEKWLKYVEDKQMDWINGEDPYVQSNFRYDYDIRTTPIIYILDKDKKIIAKKIAAENITKFIEIYQKEGAN
ncbi:DUF5106 domain-containing protein [Persicobacter sp. CCB-QB2]|uniref:DUF5106 domain-containing protein n=1 Tax=Persicobacter sp. CCB-QB2 TaxID=1561025 RepID=UPI0006A9672C|nr:DUF5106 domain-containing protein [Persicobacter sp. CCB-QB2]